MRNNRLKYIFLVVLVILLIPLIAMQFTTEVNWNIFDFIIAGFLIFCVGFMLNFILEKIQSKKYRILITLLLFITFALIWTELAVGIFNTPFAGS